MPNFLNLKKVFFAVLVLFSVTSFPSFSQCSFTNLNTQYCVDDATVSPLTGAAQFFGPGITGSAFSPSTAGVGTHTVYATSGVASTYNVSNSGTFNFVTTGFSAPTVLGKDQETGLIGVGFTFNFFGTNYTNVRLGSNGVLGVGSDTPVTDPNNASYSNATDPDNLIAAAWDDMIGGTTVRTQTIGTAPMRKFIADFDMKRSGGAYTVKTQIHIYESTNIIEIHTQTAPFLTNSNLATQAIEGPDPSNVGSNFYVVSGRNNQSWNATNDYVAFIPSCLQSTTVVVNDVPSNGLSVTPASTAVCASQSVPVTIVGDQAGVEYQLQNIVGSVPLSGLFPGDGAGSLVINSDPIPSNLTIKVYARKIATGCDIDLTNTVAVTVNPVPSAPSITPIGPLSACVGTGTISLTSSAPSGASTYQWYKNGIAIGGSTLINYSVIDNLINNGSYTVTAIGVGPSLCASVQSASVSVTFNALPTPTLVASATTICAGVSVTFTAGSGAGPAITNYDFKVNGTSKQSGASNSFVSNSLANGDIVTVVGTTGSVPACPITSSNVTMTVNPKPTPVISGSNFVCENQTGVIYSTASSGNSYAWTISGGTITAGAGTNSITVTWGTAGTGTLQLTETIVATTCPTATPVYNVTINPSPAPLIVGTATACSGQTGFVYSTALVAGRGYSWGVTGGTVTAGAGTNSITVSWGAAGAGVVQLVEAVLLTGCPKVAIPFVVTINSLPAPSISGTNSVCANQSGVSYSTPFFAGRSYVWTVTGGTIASGAGTSSITVNWGVAGPGTVQLAETISATTCSVTTSTYNVTINTKPAPVISGAINVCANQVGVAYSTLAAGGRAYSWTVSNGTIASGASTNSIIVNWGAAGAGSVSLIETISASGCSTATSPYNVTINANPTPSITGLNTVCENQNNVSYSTSPAGGRTYAWTVSGGSIFSGAGTNSIVVNWGAAGSGTVQLTETISASTCFVTTPTTNVTINARPTPVISGAITVCANQANVNYFTSNVIGDTYSWSVSGGSIASGAGTNSINVNWGPAGAGSISLTQISGGSGCSASTAPYAISINPKPTPSIVGDNSVCANEINKPYSTTAILGNTYSWAITGGTIVGSPNTSSIIVNWGGAGTGSLLVTETISLTTCVQVTPIFNVVINSTPTPIITGPASVCANQTGVTYSTPNVVGNFYNWTVAGGTIVSGTGTNSITVDWGIAGTGTVNVTEFITLSGCAISATPSSVNINAIPTPFITGNNTVCANDINKVYSTPLIVGHTYNWTVTGGVISGSSTNNSVTINWGAAGGGTIILKETITASTCFVTTPTYNVIINNLPVPVVTGLSTVCALQTGVTYSTPNVPGNSYTWAVSGGSIVSGIGTSAITVNWGSGASGSVAVTEFIPSSSCITTTAPYSIIINPIPSPVITGSNNVCANELGKIYSTPFVVGNAYSWTVTGGTINGSSTGNSISVDWGSAGPGTVKVIETAGCFTTTPIYNVTINSIPAPLITGSATACANQSGVIYSTTNVVGNSYFWSVSGGAITAGAGTNSITVTWGSAGSGTVILKETIISSSCSITTSPTVVTISLGTSANAGTDAETCAGTAFNLNSRGAGIASASNFGSLTWTGGTGTFSNATILNPTYTPGVGETGAVTLTLTASGLGACTPAVDQMILTVTPLPLVNAGTDAELCQGNPFGFFSRGTVASASNYSSLAWTKVGGTGTIFNGNTFNPTYVPGVGESGSITFTLTATSSGSCFSVNDNMVLTITPTPSVNAGSDESVCRNTPFNFNMQGTLASASNFNSILWTTTGTGAFTNTNTLTPAYVPDASESGAITFTLTAIGNGSCVTVQDQMLLTVVPEVIVNAGSDAETCKGTAINFGLRAIFATASNYSSLLWSGGAGTILNGTTLNPTYIPTASEIGVVSLTLKATGNGSCAFQTSTMLLTITPSATVNAGSDESICRNTSFNFSTQGTPASASNFNTIAWTTSGSGVFTGANTFAPSYVPGVAESGPVTFTLKATGNGSCGLVQDQMILTVTPQVVVNAGSNAETCKGVSINFGLRTPSLASASNYNLLSWSGGAGTFINGNTLNPTYTPAIGETGVITLTLKATGNGSCAFQTSSMQLTITPSPTVNAGSDQEVCRNTNFNFSSQATLASATNYNSIAWTTTGTGTLTSANTLTPSYVPGVAESGAVTFTLTATGNGSCVTVQDQMVLTVSPPLTASAGSNEQVCQGGIFNFTSQGTGASATNYASINWTHSGAGLLSSPTTLTPIYQSTASEVGTILFTLTATGLGSCGTLVKTMQLNIRPSAIVSAGSNAETCAGTPINFALRSVLATASNFSSLIWAHTGTGTITSGSTTPSPTYAPGVGETGSVTFTLKANGIGVCPSKQSSMTLSITPAVVVDAGSNIQICQGGFISFTSQSAPAFATNSSSVLWTHNGLGTLFNTNTLTPTYFASPSETGNVTFTLKAISSGSCVFATDFTTLNIVPAPTVDAGSDEEICEGAPTFDLSLRTTIATTTNGTRSWSHNGAGSLSSTTSISPTYTLAAADFGNQITFTLKVTSGATVCSFAQDQFKLKVNRKALVSVPANYIVCQSSTIALSGTIGGAATTGLWSIVSGNGTLSATNVSGLLVTANYIVDPLVDVGSSVIFRLTSNDPDGPFSPCTTSQADVTITINKAASATAGIDLDQCKDQSTIALQGAISYAPNGVLWTGGAGIFSANTNPTSNYSFANPSEISATVPVILTLTALDPDGAGPCTAVADQMKLTINPLPIVAFTGLPPGSPANMAENQAAITLTGNQAGGSFSISPITSLIGVTTQNPVDKVPFDPSAVTLGINIITYTYTDGRNCTNKDIQSVIVNPVTSASFAIQKGTFNTLTLSHEVCGDQGDLVLTGQPDFNTFGPNQFVSLTPGLTIVQSGSPGSFVHKIPTNGLPSGTYLINYKYTNGVGASSNNIFAVKVYAGPLPAIAVDGNCISAPTTFTGSATIPASPFPTTIRDWNWDFSDGGTDDRQVTLPHTFSTSGVYNVTLEVTTNQGCSNKATQNVRVGDVPVVNYSWADICTNDNTKFLDLTKPGAVSVIEKYTWDFGDGDILTTATPNASLAVPTGTHANRTSGTFKAPFHNYSLPGVKTVKLTVNTNDLCNSSITQLVTILIGGITVAPNSVTPYFNNFDSPDTDWFAEAKVTSGVGVLPFTYSSNSWLRGTPSGNTIKTAASGTTAWWTGENILNNGKKAYYENEGSWVNGPCFDLRQLKRPMISLDYWSDSEKNIDGAVLEYTTDGGLTPWKTVGPLAAEPLDQGINWFNSIGLPSNPGDQVTGNYGWSDKQGGWKTARFNLDMVDTLERKQVRIRIAFGSNSTNDPTVPSFDGFAFDNFFIGEKKRNVLIEHFTNSTLTGSVAADTYLNNLFDKQIELRGKGDSDFEDIQYHISYSSTVLDPLNTDNANDPNARASSYGVSQPPRTFMDGIKNQKFDGDFNKLNLVEINRRALEDPKFELKLDTIPTGKKEFINVQLTMKALTSVTVPLIAQVALVEDNVVIDTKTYKNVLRKLLLGSGVNKPDGITITQTFAVGEFAVRPQPANEIEINVPIKNSKNLKLIGFVQDKNTGEIYQSIVVKGPRKVSSTIVGLGDEPTVVSNLDELQIYPNPANGKFNFGVPGNFPSGYVWKIADQRGIFLLKGDFNEATNGVKTVDISTLTNGVYFVLIGAEGATPVYRKLVVMNQD
jgi:PKD domain/PKD-like domain/Secretion system C-terminal sorting domain